MLVTTIVLALSMAEPAGTVEAKPEAAKEDKVVCKGERNLRFGSHMSAGRVCRKKSEWDELARDAKRNLQKWQDVRTDPTPARNSQPIPQ